MKTVVWRAVEYEGMEYLRFVENESSVYAHSVVIGVENQAAFRLDYIVKCDGSYVVSEANMGVDIYPPADKRLYLTSDGQGNWFDRAQSPVPELAGCIDVDISATPFTNTLPIRRLQWHPGQSETFRMVYISVPELTISVDPQRYTCLEKNEQGGVFRFESLDSGFTADITVDADGLVVHYPGLFERVV